MQLEQIRATLTADSAQFVNGFNRARGAMNDFTVRSGQSQRAMGIMRNGMVALATQATGVQSSVGRLAQGLLMLGGGGTLVLGVAAGIGAISYAYKLLTQDTREAEEAQKDLVKALQGVGVHAQLTAARMELAAARAALGPALDVSQRGFFGRIGAVFATEGQEVTRQEEALRRVAAAENAVAQAAQRVAKWQAGIAADANREAEARLRSLAALDKTIAKMLSKDVLEAGRLKGMTDPVGSKFVTEGMRDSLNSLPNKMRYGLEQAGISESMRDFGISIGRQFAMGMLEGIQSMQDLLKMVIMSILDFAFGALLGAIFPPAAAVGGGLKGTAGLPKSPVGPASMSLNLSGMPSASTPMAAARDAQWQSFLRESWLVAKAQGFHG